MSLSSHEQEELQSLVNQYFDDSDRVAVLHLCTLVLSRPEVREQEPFAMLAQIRGLLNFQFATLLSGDERDDMKKKILARKEKILKDEFVKGLMKILLAPTRTTAPLHSPFFGIRNTKRTNQIDLDQFTERVKELFDWYREVERGGNEKLPIAPYFPIVQSSGTGKTKLVYDFKAGVEADASAAANEKEEPRSHRRKLNDDEFSSEMAVVLICCLEESIDTEGYDMYLDNPDLYVDGSDKEKDSTLGRICKLFNQRLNHAIEAMRDRRATQVVLIFDEAQNLAERNNGFLLRCLRWFLRVKRSPMRIVAVLLGTTGSIAHLFPETETSTTFSRLGNDDANFYMKVNSSSLFPPMIDLWTVGALSERIRFDPKRHWSEYTMAIPYGRPLFARMLVPEDVDMSDDSPVDAQNAMSDLEHIKILQKMMLSCNDLPTSRLAQLSILATRVQLGAVSANIVSELVSKGYAHMIFYRRQAPDYADVAHFAFMPDPVCARLAMCMMDDGFQPKALDSEHNGGGGSGPSRMRTIQYQGFSKSVWVKWLGTIVTMNLCRPPRGDLGECLVALYLLFCGDELRKKKDEHYETFSVDLDRVLEKFNPKPTWTDDSSGETRGRMDLVSVDQNDTMAPGPTSIDASVADEASGNESDADMEEASGDSEHTTSETGRPTVSFIQFCRNELRYAEKQMFSQDFLAYLYKAGIMMYAHDGCTAYDAAGAISCFTNGVQAFFPFLLSIKTCAEFRKGKQLDAVESMIKVLSENKVRGGFCLLVLLDPDTDEIAHDFVEASVKSPRNHTSLVALTRASLNADVDTISQDMVARIVSIPKHDDYGISALVSTATRYGNESAELFVSHSFMRHLNLETVSDKMRKSKDHRSPPSLYPEVPGANSEIVDNKFLQGVLRR